MENHVKLSVGLNFSECTPIKGTFKGFATHKLVSVSIGFYGRYIEEINDVQLQNDLLRFRKLDHAEQATIINQLITEKANLRFAFF
jgi:hypothetical protein